MIPKNAPGEYLLQVLSSIRDTNPYIPEIVIEKFTKQFCEPNTEGALTSIGNWQAKTSYYYGTFWRRTPWGKLIKQFCLYHGKARIHSGHVARLSHKLARTPGPWYHIFKYQPWLRLWDDPEYYRIWKDAKYQKKISFKLADGSIEYRDDQDQHQIISLSKQAEFKALDTLQKEIDIRYKACMDKPTERIWR